MANLIINDLAESRELDRQAMVTILGGVARGFLFTFPLAQQQSSFPSIINVFNLTQIFVADTIQIIKQDLSIVNSNNVVAGQLAETQNLVPEIATEVPSTPSLPSF